MRVYLCDLVHNQTAGTNQISGGQDFVVPLNVAGLAAYVKDQLKNLVEISVFKYPQDLLDEMSRNSPDIVGFSNYIWNEDLNAKIGSFIRQEYPGVLTLMGGPSIRDDDAGIEDFLRRNPYLDIYTPFEGDKPFLGILKKFISEGRGFLNENTTIPGCAYLFKNELVYLKSVQNRDVNDLVSPYLTGVLDKFLHQGLIPLFETNRGCPFLCTFCAWGNVDLNKVRKFSMDRVYAEMEYVAQNFPNLSAWIIGDANFGMLARDLEIAKEIRDIKRRTPALKHILIWESKNTSERNLEIARIMGNDLGEVLMAVQTLDEEAQVAIKRDNISLADIPKKIKSFHASGVRVQTHVLSGLPGETYLGHLDTLKKCFELGFDDLQVFSTLLVPGSEMELQKSRETFNIQTRYRVRQGSYGEYHGIKSIECEEIIRGNSAISEEEMLSLRPLHWLVWYGWNHGFLKPVLKFAQKEHGINPLDVMVEIVEASCESHPQIAKLFSDFRGLAQGEWFESRKSLYDFYFQEKNWDKLFSQGFSKVEFKYNSLLIIAEGLYDDLLELLHEILRKREPSIDAELILRIMRERLIHPDSLFNDGVNEEKNIPIPHYLTKYILDFEQTETKGQDKEVMLKLVKSSAQQGKVKAQLSKYRYSDNKQYAVEKTLGTDSGAFVYQVSIN